MEILRSEEGPSGTDWIGMRSLAAVYRMLMRSRTLLLVLGLMVTPAVRAQVDEYRVKAFFLYNFARYAEWPPHGFASPSDPIEICVLGQNPFGSSLEEAVSGKVVGGRTFRVRLISEIQPKCNCHILFVSASERKRFRSNVGNIKGTGVLTVGETQGFTNDGGVINFKLEDGKVRFEISVEAAAQEHIRLSSKLLSLAQIVRN